MTKLGELIGSPCGTARVWHEITLKREGANTQVPEDLSQNGDGRERERERARERESERNTEDWSRSCGAGGDDRNIALASLRL